MKSASVVLVKKVASRFPTAVVGVLVWSVLSLPVATAQQDGAVNRSRIRKDMCVQSLEDLARLPWSELECLYRNSAAGVIPDGFVQGQSFVPHEKRLSTLRTFAINGVWRGKHFCSADCSVVNQWRIGRAIRGDVYYGTSWMDGKPAIIIDYRQTSRVWSDARDEMREVAPGLYVGVMHLQKKCGLVIRYYFVLESQRCIAVASECVVPAR